MNKKNLIIQAIRLGHDFDTACLLAGVDMDDIETLAEDTSLQKLVALAEANLQNELLTDFHTGNAKALEKGSTAGTQWMLGKVNPDKFGSNKKVELGGELAIPASIRLGRGDTNGKKKS